MKTIQKIAMLTIGLGIVSSAAAAQTETTAPAPAPAAQAAPAPTPTPTPDPTAPVGENWKSFSRSAIRIYMTDVNGFTTTGDVVRARIARVPLTGQPGDYSYAGDEVEFRCTARQSRTVASTEYGPDGVQTDRYEDPEEWSAYGSNTRDAYLSQLVCDQERAPGPTWPSIKAFIDGGRQ